MFGERHRGRERIPPDVSRFPNPFGADADDEFDGYDEFVPAHLPEPGPFLEGQDVLTGREHAAFHALTRDLFERRKVYDMTFNDNLARLNLDMRHPGAGYRYAIDRDDPGVLRAAFTPTTPFCPQTHTLTIGSFRAWNGLTEAHEYDLVSVRVAPMHHQSQAVNQELTAVETRFQETGSVETRPEAPADRKREAGGGEEGWSPDRSDVPF